MALGEIRDSIREMVADELRLQRGGQSDFLYGTWTGRGSGAGLNDITILGQPFKDVPQLAHIEGQLMDTLYYTSSGTFVKANYPGLGWVVVEMVGGGGGGGGPQSTSATQTASSGGGGGGVYARGKIGFDDLSTSETVTVGSGGNPGTAGNTGGAGGQSRFGNHIIANGGTGGLTRAPSNLLRGSSGASQTTGGTGDLVIPGGGGGGGVSFGDPANWSFDPGVPGQGGVSFFSGASRVLRGANVDGSEAGLLYGGGGSGTVVGPSESSPSLASPGAPGVVIVHLYSGFSEGCSVLCVRNSVVPLTIVGIVAGDSI